MVAPILAGAGRLLGVAGSATLRAVSNAARLGLRAGTSRGGSAVGAGFTLEWFGQKVEQNISIGMESRVKIAAQLLRDKVVLNISRPVTKLKGVRSGRTVVDPDSRSKPGEYPKADTTRLMKDIFWQMQPRRGRQHRAIVGTTLDYGAILELSSRLNRSYLRRTHREEFPRIRQVLLNGSRLPGQE